MNANWWRRVRLLFQRELIDLLRDRRTLWAMFALPVLLSLGVQLVVSRVSPPAQPASKPLRILLLENDAPSAEGQLPGGAAIETAAMALEHPGCIVVREDDGDAQPSSSTSAEAELVAVGRLVRTMLSRHIPDLSSLHPFAAHKSLDFLKANGIDILAIRTGSGGPVLSDSDVDSERPESEWVVLYDDACPDVCRGVGRLNSAVSWSELGEYRIHELTPSRFDTSETRQLTAALGGDSGGVAPQLKALWGRLFPAILISLAAVGAFYPAIDVCVGERERGTLETLLISPLGRMEVVAGKFSFVLVFCVLLTSINLVSLTSAVARISRIVAAPVPLPQGSSLVPAIVMLVIVAAQFSALSVALACTARSVREAQYYLAPFLVCVSGCTLVSLDAKLQLTPTLSVIPVIGSVLWLAAHLETGHAAAPGVTVLYVVSSVFYCSVVIFWALQRFRSETILIGEQSQGPIVRLWNVLVMRHRPPPHGASEPRLRTAIHTAHASLEFDSRLRLERTETTGSECVD